ncbi:ras-related protein rab-24 [Anaeramoeba flamelloides]|uniref:Ras-related protein rab-24 n=2 Tax=Anaeramoeba flamelloides TaxID=1746091 RepID=A0AAV7Z0F6_9EUKA|nr:ras-related protein rab-24 [Anaeramoeba flamelloides]
MSSLKKNDKVDVKIVFLGDTFVGKTCLVERFIHNNFNDQQQNTIGVSFAAKSIFMDQKKLTLGIWDTAGQERFNSMAKMYYRKSEAAIVCYDVTNSASIEKLQNWIEELKECVSDCKIFIAGTKFDLLKTHDREVSNEDIKEIAKKYSATCFETSAKEDVGVKEMFNEITKQMIIIKEDKTQEKKMKREKKEDDLVDILSDGKKDSNCC